MLRKILLFIILISIACFSTNAQKTIEGRVSAKIHKMNFSEVARYELAHPPLLKKKKRAPNEEEKKIIINNPVDKSVPPFTGIKTLVPIAEKSALSSFTSLS